MATNKILNAKSYQDFFAFLNKCNSLGAATKWNAMETPDTVNFPTWIHDCDSHSPALLDLFISADTSIHSIMAFHPLGNSDHVVVSVSIDFPLNSK